MNFIKKLSQDFIFIILQSYTTYLLLAVKRSFHKQAQFNLINLNFPVMSQKSLQTQWN